MNFTFVFLPRVTESVVYADPFTQQRLKRDQLMANTHTHTHTESTVRILIRSDVLNDQNINYLHSKTSETERTVAGGA